MSYHSFVGRPDGPKASVETGRGDQPMVLLLQLAMDRGLTAIDREQTLFAVTMAF